MQMQELSGIVASATVSPAWLVSLPTADQNARLMPTVHLTGHAWQENAWIHVQDYVGSMRNVKSTTMFLSVSALADFSGILSLNAKEVWDIIGEKDNLQIHYFSNNPSSWDYRPLQPHTMWCKRSMFSKERSSILQLLQWHGGRPLYSLQAWMYRKYGMLVPTSLYKQQMPRPVPRGLWFPCLLQGDQPFPHL